MKHQNESMNMTLAEAQALRETLNWMGFMVQPGGLSCNPNVLGQAGVTAVPEINIPRDGQAYNLEFIFEGSNVHHNCTVVRGLLGSGAMANIKTLYHTIHPHESPDMLSGQLMRVPELGQLVAVRIAERVNPPKPPKPELAVKAPKKRVPKERVPKNEAALVP